MIINNNRRIIQGTGRTLSDRKSNWRIKKLTALAVSDVHLTLRRAQAIESCGSTLFFVEDEHGKMRLVGADFCRDRLCPMCQWRRSLVIFNQVRRVCTELESERPGVAFIMLTLTVPNVSGNQLRDELSRLTNCLKKLFKRKEVKQANIGYFRSLEITYNESRKDYHPHFHVLIAVSEKYFKGRNYITQSRWLELWREVTGQPEITQVDVRRIRGREYVDKETGEVTENPIASAAAEVGKYATKPADYIERKGKDFYQANASVVNLLAEALKGKRLIGWGGDMDKIRKRLALSDAEGRKVDLVATGGDSEQMQAVFKVIYKWVPGLKNYVN